MIFISRAHERRHTEAQPTCAVTRTWSSFALVAANFSALIPSSGHAQLDAPSQVVVHWHSTAQCGSGDDVLLRLRASLGSDVERMLSTQVWADVEAHAENVHVTLLVVSPGTSVTRELDARDCESAIDASATLISLALHEIAFSDPTEEATSMAPSPVETAACVAATEEHAPASLAPASPLVLGVAGWFGVATGLPSPVGSFELEVRTRRQHVDVAAGASTTMSDSIDVDESHPNRALATRHTGILRVGYAFDWGRVALAAHAGFVLGSLSVQGTNLDQATRITRLWAAPIVDVEISFALTRTLFLSAAIRGSWLMARPTFEIAGLGYRWSPDPIAFDALLGLRWMVI